MFSRSLSARSAKKFSSSEAAIARGLSGEDTGVVAGMSRRWGRGGSARVAGCRRSAAVRCQGVTYRWRSGRRSRSCAPTTAVCARSPGGLAGHRRRSRASCAVTPRLAAATCSTGPRLRSGMPIDVAGARRWPSWRVNDAMRQYVQDRLAGMVTSADGQAVAGPDVRWIGRRQDRRWATS